MNLRNKLAFFIALNSYVEMIVRGTSPLSLPDAIADSLEYLKAFGGTEQRNLPSGYTELEYIESTGTQYIDTGITATSNTGFKIVYEYTDTGSAAIAGIFQIVNPRTDALFVTSNTGTTNSTLFCAQAGAQVNTSTIIALNTKYVCEINYMNSGYMGFDGDITTQIGTNGVYTGKTIPLFARYSVSGDNYAISNSKIYSAVFTEGNTISHNFIPCKDPNGVVGMFDTVTQTFFTNAGTGTFTAGADVVVPTPDAPMDIVSNNGVLKARHQSGLPWGYTLLEYIESTGTQYIDTGITNVQTGSAVEVTFQPDNYVGWHTVYGNKRGATDWVAYTLNTATQKNSYIYGTYYDIDYPITTDKHTIRQESNKFYLDGTLAYTTAERTFTNDTNLLLFARATANAEYMFHGKIYAAKIWNDGTMVGNFIPCKNASNVVGMYDLVSGQFFTNAGTGAFTAGNAVNDIEVYADDTVETINVHGKNLFDITSLTRNAGYMVSTVNGLFVTSDQYTRSDYMPCLPNTEYTRTASGAASTVFYDRNKNFLSARTGIPFTTPADCHYIIYNVRNNVDYSQGMMVKGDELPTTYQPYFDGGTATAEMLLSVGNYTDEQEVISGAVTRNVGVKVFDGTEDIGSYSSVWVFPVDNCLRDSSGPLVSSHLVFNPSHTSSSSLTNGEFCIRGATGQLFVKLSDIATAEGVQQWLADQYAAGTPVIVVYPLATPTTESVAGQAMQVQQGDNIVEITQASLDNLELEAKYEKRK